MYSREELEDLSVEFSLDNDDELYAFEGDLVEATRQSDYDTFMAVYGKLKDFCYKAGPGGRFYFDNMWKDDPRIKSLKQIKDGPIYSDVVSMLQERGPSESKDIYVLVGGVNYKVLQSLIRKKEIQRIPGSHVYYLPDHDISGIVEDMRRKEEEARRIAEEYGNSGPIELTLPSAEELWDRVQPDLEEGLRAKGYTEEQIDQVFGRKKKRGFFSLFRKKK